MKIMAMLGGFVFSANKKEFHTLDKSTTYSYAQIKKIKSPSEYHAVGASEQKITLSGTINALEGGSDPFVLLEAMAEVKIEYPLFLGNGKYLGNFKVDRIAERGTKIFDNGVPIDNRFTIQLTRTNSGLLYWVSSLAHLGSLF